MKNTQKSRKGLELELEDIGNGDEILIVMAGEKGIFIFYKDGSSVFAHASDNSNLVFEKGTIAQL
jgi:hypothetical protein